MPQINATYENKYIEFSTFGILNPVRKIICEICVICG